MRHVLLLRGINLGKRRVGMAELRALLGEAGYGDVQTYVQSGNVVLTSPAKPAELARAVGELISDRFGFAVPVVARSRAQLAEVVARNPLGEVAENPKLHQVTFLSAPLGPDAVARLEGLVASGEALAVHGPELYTWHPHGVARSKLAAALGAQWLGVTATARNWTTVTTLLEMAGT